MQKDELRRLITELVDSTIEEAQATDNAQEAADHLSRGGIFYIIDALLKDEVLAIAKSIHGFQDLPDYPEASRVLGDRLSGPAFDRVTEMLLRAVCAYQLNDDASVDPQAAVAGLMAEWKDMMLCAVGDVQWQVAELARRLPPREPPREPRPSLDEHADGQHAKPRRRRARSRLCSPGSR